MLILGLTNQNQRVEIFVVLCFQHIVILKWQPSNLFTEFFTFCYFLLSKRGFKLNQEQFTFKNAIKMFKFFRNCPKLIL